MPPKAAPPVTGLNATEAEIRLAFALLKFMRRPTTAAVYDDIAAAVGSASGDSVRHGVRKAADKHAWFSQAPADEPGSAAATPRPRKTATPRKKKIAEVNDADDDNNNDEAGGAAAAQGEQQEDEGTPKKKRARKAKAKAVPAAAAAAAPAATEKEAPEEEEEDKEGPAKEPVAAESED
ncbi:hypothetical protein LX36DRAFT_713652 [Colletotrichum falcatum]|nr:hypothetical protein LX36DRAFT_713652 [Colletotrichum falcatum]